MKKIKALWLILWGSRFYLYADGYRITDISMDDAKLIRKDINDLILTAELQETNLNAVKNILNND